MCLNINVCQIISFDQELKGEPKQNKLNKTNYAFFVDASVDKRGGMRLHNEFYLDNMAQSLHFRYYDVAMAYEY